eukprot:2694003-Rhodomonas_salina.2
MATGSAESCQWSLSYAPASSSSSSSSPGPGHDNLNSPPSTPSSYSGSMAAGAHLRVRATGSSWTGEGAVGGRRDLRGAKEG